MSYPKISVITPSYNQGQFIEETILSVIQQDYPNLEYIVIDGGSSDNTIDVIKKYQKDLAFWVSEKDSGQSEAINKGFRKATGDIVCWINSDDLLMPGALEKVAQFFANNKQVDFLNGYTAVIDQDMKVTSVLLTLKQKRWYAKHGIYYVNQPAMFWKRSILNSVGLLREEFHAEMDKELLIRIFEHDVKIGQLNKLLAAFRKHEAAKSMPGGISETWYKNDEHQLFKMYGAKYSQKPQPVYKTIYRLEKVLKGLYLEKWFFLKRWKGHEIKRLSAENCSYL